MQCGRAKCAPEGRAVRHWLWSEVELGFRFSPPPWEKFCAPRTFLCFLTRRWVAETISYRRGRGEGERLGEEVIVGKSK